MSLNSDSGAIDREVLAAVRGLTYALESGDEPRSLRHPDHANRIDPIKNRVRRILAGYFRRQKKAILDDVRLRFWHHEMPVREADAPSGKTRAAELLPENLSPLTFATTPREDLLYQKAISSAIAQAQQQLAKEISRQGSIGENKVVQYLEENSLKKLTGGLAETTKTRLRAAIAQAVDEGGTADEIVAAIQDEMAEFSTQRAELIAQTEINDAYSWARHEMADATGMTEKKWVPEGPNPCDDCLDNEYVEWIGITDAFPAGAMYPTQHPMCLPGATAISAPRILCAIRRWYEGEICVLSFAGLPDLTITPNHPILAKGRTVPAGSLKIGDYVAKRLTPSDSADFSDPNNYDVKSTAEQIFNALILTRGCASHSVPVSAEAFHGDAIANDKVDIVWAAGHFSSNLKMVDYRMQRQLRRGHRPGIGLPSHGDSTLFFNGANTASRSDIGRRRHSHSLFRAESVVSDSLSRSHVTLLETDRFPCPDDGRSADSYGPGYSEQAFSGQVLPVQILGVKRVNFSGHVFNFETDSGWYDANSIVVHNCFCTADYRLVTAGEGK